MEGLRRALVFCAHSDDQALGAGGYIAALARQGVEVRTIICSFGEYSHPHLKPKEVQKTRVLESKKADRILGGSGVAFLGVREGRFEQDFKERALAENVARQLREFDPQRILTHSEDDPHPDHRAARRMLLEVYGKAGLAAEVYTFDVWNLFNLRKRRHPKLIVDVTKTFKKKLDAIDTFRSQKVALVMLLWSVYTKAIFWGLKRGTRYAEVYYKVK